MSFEFEDTKPNITNEDLLADLRRVAALLGTGVLTQRAYRHSGRYSTTVIKKRFGKWKTAVATAGFEAGSEQRIPVDDLFDNLREVWMKLGRQPRKREMISPLSEYTHHPYVRLFGGWVNAMRIFTRTVNENELEVSSVKSSPPRDGRGPREPFAPPVPGDAAGPLQVCLVWPGTSNGSHNRVAHRSYYRVVERGLHRDEQLAHTLLAMQFRESRLGGARRLTIGLRRIVGPARLARWPCPLSLDRYAARPQSE